MRKAKSVSANTPMTVSDHGELVAGGLDLPDSEGIYMRMPTRFRTQLTVVIFVGALAAEPSAAGVRFGGTGGAASNLDLEEFVGLSASLGTAHATLESTVAGISFGEKLLGQAVGSDGFFDVVTGTPTVPLTLDTTIDGGTGVNVIQLFGSTAIDGLGALGFPNRDAIAEGALTVLYDLDQRLVAFDVLGANGAFLRIQFFNRSGAPIGDIAIDNVNDGTLVFSSDARDIAAMTLTNKDRGGLAYDNFQYIPATANVASDCSAGGPYAVPLTGDLTALPLTADVVGDPNGLLRNHFWTTNCPMPSFDDPTLQDPSLFVDTTGVCLVVCEVTLIVTDATTTEFCSATVTISGDSGPGVTCPADVTVESDGLGNVEALDAWMASAVSSDPALQNDFAGIVFGCGSTGSATVTWSVPTSGTGPCAAASLCSATFTIGDSTPPVLTIDTTPIVVVDTDCDGVWEFDLPQATASDGGTITNDEPDPFPIGLTTVTYTATDECGLTTSAAVEVGLLFGSGIDVEVFRRRDHDEDDDDKDKGKGKDEDKSGSDDEDDDGDGDREGDRGHSRASKEPLAGVPVLIFDRSKGSCARDAGGKGKSQRSLETIVSECDPVNSGRTDEDGYAPIDVPPGKYLVVVPVDLDGDGVPDRYLRRKVGRLRCGRWKEAELTLKDR